MRPILIYSGTSEGKRLSYALAQNGIYSVVCVATEYGEMVMEDNEFIKINRGRLSADEMRGLLNEINPLAVVDATHPFAGDVTKNIKDSMSESDIPYLRLKRNTYADFDENDNVKVFENTDECVQALCSSEGNILLTTGSKELISFVDEKIVDRLFVRVLPSVESLMLCSDAGIEGKQIIAMHGPFSKDINKAILKQYNIKNLVTKESGKAGGLQEKLQAAKELGVTTYMIGNPEKGDGLTYMEVVDKLSELLGMKLGIRNAHISLVGVGMGNVDTLTKKVSSLIQGADYLLGAERLIANYTPRYEKKPYYLSSDIIPYLNQVLDSSDCKANIAILFSGDTGFYSACGKVYEALIENGYDDVSIEPGISTISYLASKHAINWNDARIMSIHGASEEQWMARIIYELKYEKKIFLLMSGKDQLNVLMKVLYENNYQHIELMLGYQLSYEEEKIFKFRIKDYEEYAEELKEGLYALFLVNDAAIQKVVAHGIKDDEFIRGKTPMTKAEVRDISISKLKPASNSVVYDIGSGTGSIAVGIASLSGDIKVYAFECNKEAISLIGENKKKFGCTNIEIIKGMAPASMKKCQAPDYAFIGGSKDNLYAILDSLYEKNSSMRVVINAISMETAQKLFEIPKLYNVCDYEVVQLQVNRARIVGNYNMMHGENPIFVCSFNFCEGKIDE